MTTDLSKLQLNTVLSALDGQPRNPNSRDAALKRIARHAADLGIGVDDLLAAATGLLDGRMDAAAFVAALRAPSASRHETEPMVPNEDAAADQPVLSTFAASDESIASDQTEAESQANASCESAATDQPTATHCPSCGRKLRAARTQAAPQPRPHREGSKEALVIDLLRRPEGATIAQLMAATGWQSHTVRGVFAGALKKRRGLAVTSEKPRGGERIYRIA